MKTKQAKDFLVQQTAEQAARESVPLSETEQKMMYFTESDATSCDNPVELNEEFEAQYDTAEYETKISRLLHHAYDRLKLEDPEGKRSAPRIPGCARSVIRLRPGDVYMLFRKRGLTALLFAATSLAASLPAQTPVSIRIDAQGATTPFPHFWEQTFGSGRAILSLRESYRNDLRTVKQATDFQSIRFHGIFLDEVGLYDPDRQVKNPGLGAQAANDSSAYNFSYIDQIYDGLLANGVRPFVELTFMPRKMAADPTLTTSLLVSPCRITSKGLQALGRHDACLWQPSDRAIRHR